MLHINRCWSSWDVRALPLLHWWTACYTTWQTPRRWTPDLCWRWRSQAGSWPGAAQEEQTSFMWPPPTGSHLLNASYVSAMLTHLDSTIQSCMLEHHHKLNDVQFLSDSTLVKKVETWFLPLGGAAGRDYVWLQNDNHELQSCSYNSGIFRRIFFWFPLGLSLI